MFIFAASLFCYTNSVAQDTFTTTGAKLPKHYFTSIFVLNAYRKPGKQITDTLDYQSRRLKTYGIRQRDIFFCLPLATFEDKSDTTVKKNSHLLLTGNYSVLMPQFEGIPDHKLVKLGIGIRYIINTGKKGIWFFDAAPFITRDLTYASKAYYSLASTIVYSHNPSARFSWRIGLTKSFLWGNRFYWPFVGLRFGRLDKCHLSIQFPRNIILNLPLSSKLIFSFYTKPQGGMYNFSNHDSLYPKKTTATFNFTRYEINSGLRIDARFTNNFNFFVSLGVSSRNQIVFYSESANTKRPRAPYRNYFYSQAIQPTLFLDLGLVFKFGKTRSYYNDKNLYDAMNLNGIMTADNNAQIPIPNKKSDLNLETVRDLVDYNDF